MEQTDPTRPIVVSTTCFHDRDFKPSGVDVRVTLTGQEHADYNQRWDANELVGMTGDGRDYRITGFVTDAPHGGGYRVEVQVHIPRSNTLPAGGGAPWIDHAAKFGTAIDKMARKMRRECGQLEHNKPQDPSKSRVVMA